LRGVHVGGDRDWRVVTATDRALLGGRMGDELKGYLSSGLINDMAITTTTILPFSSRQNTTIKQKSPTRR
jgi:hypothetical protein